MYRPRFDWFNAGVIAVCALILAVVVGMYIADCNKRDACRDRGGRVDEYNCRTVVVCHSTGKATFCAPTRACDWRCADVPAEREVP